MPDEYNPSEWIIYKLAVQPGQEKQSNDRIQKIVEQYEDSDHQKRVMEQLSDVSEKIPPPEMHRANVFTQIFALSTRLVLMLKSVILLTRSTLYYIAFYIVKFTYKIPPKCILCSRCGIDVWRAPQLTLAKVIQKILFGLFIGLLYLRVSILYSPPFYQINFRRHTMHVESIILMEPCSFWQENTFTQQHTVI